MAVDTFDAVENFTHVLRAWEVKTPVERTELKIIDDTLVDWLGREFAEDAKNLVRVKNPSSVEWFKRRSLLSQEFAVTLHLLGEDSRVSDEHRQSEIERGLSSKLKLLTDTVGKRVLLGWMSNLTFADMLKKSIKKSDMKIRDFFASPSDDATSGTDFILDYEENGVRHINLIQLKSTGDGKGSVEFFNESNVTSQGAWVGSRMLETETVTKMFKKRDELLAAAGTGQHVVAGCFMVEVPSYDHKGVKLDVFGRVLDESVVKSFTAQAEASGLVPKGGI
ncbi:MAG: hypothetical protein HYV90_05305 [Candidatus Woesebacteria bacterium]|nr:MAG: hypothetical protein HYV90_05305 [Candidatus Woesebacteria bacterium]